MRLESLLLQVYTSLCLALLVTFFCYRHRQNGAVLSLRCLTLSLSSYLPENVVNMQRFLFSNTAARSLLPSCLRLWVLENRIRKLISIFLLCDKGSSLSALSITCPGRRNLPLILHRALPHAKYDDELVCLLDHLSKAFSP